MAFEVGSQKLEARSKKSKPTSQEAEARAVRMIGRTSVLLFLMIPDCRFQISELIGDSGFLLLASGF